MRLVGVLILACVPVLALTATGCSKGDDGKKDTAANKDNTTPAKTKTNAEKIVGMWQMIKPSPPKEAGEAVFEFTKDGKLIINMGGKQTADTYKVEGDTLTTAGKGLSETEQIGTAKIKTLNDSTLIIEDQKSAKPETVEFKRK